MNTGLSLWVPRLRRAVSQPRLVGRVMWRVTTYLHRRKLRSMGVVFGKGTTISPSATFMDHGMVTIGENCSISGAVFATHSGFDRIASIYHGRRIDSRRPIVIGDRCFIGAFCTICAGVTIGNDVVVGAGTTVRHNVPDGSVVVSQPPVIIGSTADFLERLGTRY